MNWRPIETAPKDGQSILIGWQDEEYGWQTRCAWWDTQFDLKWDEEKEDSYYRPAWTDARIMSFNYEETYSYEPTHWMPLPPPPSTEPVPQDTGEWLDIPNELGWWWKWFQDQDGTYSEDELRPELVDAASLRLFRSSLKDCRGKGTVIKYQKALMPSKCPADHDLSQVVVVKKEVLEEALQALRRAGGFAHFHDADETTKACKEAHDKLQANLNAGGEG